MKPRLFNILFVGLLWIVHLPALSVTSGESNASPQNADKNVQADTIHVVGHAHMDMNWLCTYFETMKMCNDNLRQTVAFMEEYPDFTMIQSQAAVYKFAETIDPPLFKKIQKYVKEGRLEPGGGMWTEGDTNLSSGEALSRSFLFGQRYFRQHFGRMAKVGWLPDNFGHTSQLPQMLKLSGLEYYYLHRCKPYLGSFWWEGPDRSRVLCYGNDTYNGNITPQLKDELQKIAPDKHRVLQVTGVGDHGGGPTRANIEMVHGLDKTPGYPAVKFTTASDFFRKLSGEMNGRPTHKGEMQFVFEGCYTTVSEIKSGNRDCENSLFVSEFFNTLRWLNGDKYPQRELNELWEAIVFNQFHDILPGSAIYEANRQAVARYTETERKAKELKDAAFFKMADEVKFRQGLGQPVVAYNLFPVTRKTIVEVTVYSHEEPLSVSVAGWGTDYYGKDFKPVEEKEKKEDAKGPSYRGLSYSYKPVQAESGLATVLVRDGSGKQYPAQIVYSKPTPPGFTSKIQFVEEHFPPGGYKTYYIDVNNKGKSDPPLTVDNNTFETDFFTVKFNMGTGGIKSLFDKRSKTEYVRKGGELNQLKMYIEEKEGRMKSWAINKIVKEENVDHVASVKVIEKGPVRACVETVKTWGKSRFIERTYIYKSYPRIEYDLEVHWLETGSDTTDSPMLRAVFPLNLQSPEFSCQVPFNVVERPVNGQEVPAQRWVDVTDGNKGIALLNRTKYGHSFHHGDLRLTLMRSAGNPDIYPNLGKFELSYALYPHPGDWKNGVWQEGDDFNVPVQAHEPPSLALVKTHATRPEMESFISLEGKGVYMSGLKKAEGSEELIIRMVEVEGKETLVNIQLPIAIGTARRLNLVEMPLENAVRPTINERSVQIRIRPHEIVTLGLLPVKQNECY